MFDSLLHLIKNMSCFKLNYNHEGDIGLNYTERKTIRISHILSSTNIPSPPSISPSPSNSTDLNRKTSDPSAPGNSCLTFSIDLYTSDEDPTYSPRFNDSLSLDEFLPPISDPVAVDNADDGNQPATTNLLTAGMTVEQSKAKPIVEGDVIEKELESLLQYYSHSPLETPATSQQEAQKGSNTEEQQDDQSKQMKNEEAKENTEIQESKSNEKAVKNRKRTTKKQGNKATKEGRGAAEGIGGEEVGKGGITEDPEGENKQAEMWGNAIEDQLDLKKFVERKKYIKITKGKEESKYYEIIKKEKNKNYTLNLGYLLENFPEYSGIISKKNYFHVFITSLLSNSTEISTNNILFDFIFCDKNNEKKELKEIKLKIIENDSGFLHQSTGGGMENDSSGGNRPFEIRNMIYLFPQMDEYIDEKLLLNFLQISPELFLIYWLITLQSQNKLFNNYIENKIFDFAQSGSKDEERTLIDGSKIYISQGANKKTLEIPIQLPRGLIRKLFRLIINLQNYIKQKLVGYENEQINESAINLDNKIKFNDLFHLIHPEVANYYDKIRENYSMLEGIEKIYSDNLVLSNKIDFFPFPSIQGSLNEYFYFCSNYFFQEVSKRKNVQDIEFSLGELFLEIYFSSLWNVILFLFIKKLNYFKLKNLNELILLLFNQNQLIPILIDYFSMNVFESFQINRSIDDLGGYTLLHLAVTRENFSLVKCLIKNKANVNAKDIKDETPLDKALKRNLKQYVTELLQNNAKPSIPYSYLLDQFIKTSDRSLIRSRSRSSLKTSNSLK